MTKKGDLGTRSSAEYVLNGHPDKLADIAADAVLDAYLSVDPNARVACELLIAKDLVVAAGEITSTTQIDLPGVLRRVIAEVGYTSSDAGLDSKAAKLVMSFSEQSKSLREALQSDWPDKCLRAGDQAIAIGFAAANSFGMIPPASFLAKSLALALNRARTSGEVPFLLPDGKTLVCLSEDGDGLHVDRVVASVQHRAHVETEAVHEAVSRVVMCCLEAAAVECSQPVIVNPPSGRFCLGGPAADTGLTGRKIVADAYGPGIQHGGGSWSGKDATKIDRCGAYAARWIAKSLVTCGITRTARVTLTYVIGAAEPVDISVEVAEGGIDEETRLISVIRDKFDLRPGALIEALNLRQPVYEWATKAAHFGVDHQLPWEQARTDL